MATTSPAALAPIHRPAAPSPARTIEQLTKDKVLGGALPVREWLAVLGPLAAKDQRGDRVRGWLGGLTIAGGILTFVLLCAGALVVAGPMALVVLVLFIGYLMKRRADLADHLRAFVVPLLRVLREDVAEDAPLELTVRLTGRFDKANLKSKISGIETYEYPWCAGKARLRDGAQLEWEVTDEARRWSVRKRGSSGKTKTKAKLALRSDVTVRLGAPKDSYALQPAQRLGPLQRVQAKTGEKRHVVTAQQSFKRKGMAGADLPLKDFLGVIALAYRAVGPIGTGGPGGGPKAEKARGA